MCCTTPSRKRTSRYLNEDEVRPPSQMVTDWQNSKASARGAAAAQTSAQCRDSQATGKENRRRAAATHSNSLAMRRSRKMTVAKYSRTRLGPTTVRGLPPSEKIIARCRERQKDESARIRTVPGERRGRHG